MRRPLLRSALAAFLLCNCAAALAADPPKAEAQPLFAEAKPLTVKSLGAPIKTMPLSDPVWALNADGKGWTRLLFYYHYSMNLQCQAMAVDTATGQAKALAMPKDATGAPWRVTTGRDGKVYMGPNGGLAIWVYDPTAMTLDVLPHDVKGAKTICAIATGTDGKIYASTTGQIHTFQLDPETRKYTYYGIQGSPRKYLPYGYSVAADEDYVYTAAGKIPWELVACNKKTLEQKVLAKAGEQDFMTVSQDRFGVSASVIYNLGKPDTRRDNFWLYKGQAILKKDTDKGPPWPVDAKARAVPPPQPEEIIDEAIPGADGKATYWWRLPADKARAPKDALAEADPKQLGWKSAEYPVKVGPGKIAFLQETPEGNVLGVGPAYLDWFSVDPKAGAFKILGKIHLSHYATAFAGGKVYLAGYPTTKLFEYDPAKPWTAGSGEPGRPAPREESPASNPRRLAYLGHIIETHHGRALAVGADGRIYVGGHAERQHVGGGLAWWDPKEAKAGGLRAPFTLYDIAALCAVDDGKKIVYSSACVTDPATGQKADAAKLFVYDTEKQDVTASFVPFPDRRTTGRILPGGGTTVIGWVPAPPTDLLYCVDLATQKVVRQTPLPAKLEGDFRFGPDGSIWSFIDKTLVRIDPKTFAFEPVGKVDPPGRIAFSGKNVLLAGTMEIRMIENVIP
jgi:hypothetical protein